MAMVGVKVGARRWAITETAYEDFLVANTQAGAA